MATTPKSPPLSTGTTSPASRYTVTPTSTAALGAAQSAIKQATGTAPPSTFTVGSTMSVSQAAPGAKFTQGSTTTPTANKAAASSPAPKNTGTSQSNVLQSILGIAPLAAVGLSVYNKVSSGVSFGSTITNISNSISSLFSLGSSQNPVNPSNTAASGFVRISPPDQFAAPAPAAPVPSTGSTNNVVDPAQRAQAALAVDPPPSTGSTNNVQDPAQRAQIADQITTDNAKSISNVQDPAQRAQAREAVATYQAPPVNEADAETNRLVRANTAADIQVKNSTPASTVDEESAYLPQDPNNYVENFTPRETKVNPHEDAASYNIESPTPGSINNVQDPAQRAQIADQVAATQAKSISNVQDPAQRAQARENVENYKAPPVDETDAETNRLVRANTAADIEIQNATPGSTIDEESAYPINTVDPNNYVENFDPPPTDEFDGIDQQITNNTYIENFDPPATDEEVAAAIAASKENVENADVPATEVDELSAYPDNPVDQKDVVDELSAYPPNPVDQVQSEDPNQSGAESNRLALRNTQAAQTEQVTQKFKAQEDWRVRLSLAPGANYLYKVAQGAAGILNPLQATEGVIFPYTPAISVSYNAAYDATEVTHSNYKFFSYKSSNVDNITITADFTAQDTSEAQYLLAVIHFFRSVTKMFYGKDPGPGPGVPPPLCYLSGLGSFQFDWHPLVINNFTYTLPTDVDYIRAMDTSSRPGINVGSGLPKGKPGENLMAQRMSGSNIQTGALAAPPKFKNDSGVKDAVTYVPTKMSITIQAHPIISRNDISNSFSLKEYATGALLRGSQRQSGGIW
jgi:chorismate mutase